MSEILPGVAKICFNMYFASSYGFSLERMVVTVRFARSPLNPICKDPLSKAEPTARGEVFFFAYLNATKIKCKKTREKPVAGCKVQQAAAIIFLQVL